MAGQFHGSSLVLLSDPTRTVWGMQRLRYTFTPLHDGSVELIGERWELDGFVRYSSVVFKSIE